MGKLADLARRAGRWLGLADTTAPQTPTAAVAGDRFDLMTWADTRDHAPALGELAWDLAERYDHVDDLLADLFLAAYKTNPQLHDRDAMDPSRLVNHQVIATLLDSPEWSALRRETIGDPYAAAMAVLAHGNGLRRMLDMAKTAQQAADAAAEARRQAADAAAELADTLDQAAQHTGADDDGVLVSDAIEQAIAVAEAAAQQAQDALDAAHTALAKANPGIRAEARAAAAAAADQAAEEAALLRSWGVEPGRAQRMSFDQRAQLAQRLRNSRLSHFSDLIGRFRQMAAGQRARRVEHVPGELIGITTGDDLTRLVPSELATLAVPALRPVFSARYAEQALMLYDSRGQDTAGQGAIIACVDCSGSMSSTHPDGYTGEAWAKACALALLDQARHARPRRDFAGILFSSPDQYRTFHFPADREPDLDAVLDFAESFDGGGTDYQTPLTAAADLLHTQHTTGGLSHGDIVLITDGECGISEDWMRTWNRRKHDLDFRVFGIAITPDPDTTRPGGVLDALSDNLRTIADLTDPSASADLFRLI